MYTHVEADPRVEPPTKLELLLARAWLLRKTIGGVALVVVLLYAFSSPSSGASAVGGDAATAALRAMQNAPAPDGSVGAAGQLAGLVHALHKPGRPRTGDAGALGAYAAAWPCMWGEELTGAPLSALTHEKSPGGWRSTCGLRKLADPCVVYSLRSHPAYDGGGNLAFEAGVLATRPSCEVHIFAAARDGVANASTLVEEHHDGSSWFTPAQASRVHLHRATVSEVDDPGARPPKRTLAGLMRELGHAHVDVLKVDLGGLEWSLFARTSGARLEPLPSVGQLQLSAYTARATAAADYVRLFNYLEAAGLRLFAKEASLSQKGRVDLAFVQARWSPEGKLYGAAAEAAAKRRAAAAARGEAPPPGGGRRGRKKWKPKIG